MSIIIGKIFVMITSDSSVNGGAMSHIDIAFPPPFNYQMIFLATFYVATTSACDKAKEKEEVSTYFGDFS